MFFCLRGQTVRCVLTLDPGAESDWPQRTDSETFSRRRSLSQRSQFTGSATGRSRLGERFHPGIHRQCRRVIKKPVLRFKKNERENWAGVQHRQEVKVSEPGFDACEIMPGCGRRLRLKSNMLN